MCYDAMVASINGPEVDRIFNETRQKVEALQAEMCVADGPRSGILPFVCS